MQAQNAHIGGFRMSGDNSRLNQSEMHARARFSDEWLAGWRAAKDQAAARLLAKRSAHGTWRDVHLTTDAAEIAAMEPPA
jgi:hypothetical protein